MIPSVFSDGSCKNTLVESSLTIASHFVLISAAGPHQSKDPGLEELLFSISSTL